MNCSTFCPATRLCHSKSSWPGDGLTQSEMPGLVTVASDVVYLMNVHPDTHSVLRLAQISSFDTID